MDQLVNEARLFEDGILPRADDAGLEEIDNREEDDAVNLIEDDDHDVEEEQVVDTAPTIDLTNGDGPDGVAASLIRIRQYLDHTKALIDQGADFAFVPYVNEIICCFLSKVGKTTQKIVWGSKSNQMLCLFLRFIKQKDLNGRLCL